MTTKYVINKIPVQTLSLTIDHIDILLEGDAPWLPKFVKRMHKAGFSMKGGFYIELSVDSHEDDGLYTHSYIPVARRIKPIQREPTNGAEASQPEFMEYMAFRNGKAAGVNWGADMVNALIVSNRGKLPENWLRHGMNDLDTGETPH